MSKIESIADRIERAMNSTTDNVVKGDLREILADLRAGGVAQAPLPRWCHKKRGSTYVEVGRGRFQAFESCHDMEAVVIYRSETDGELWVRPTNEFEDGRFEALAVSSTHAAPRSEDQS